jgi:hypothetical protein
MERGGASVIMPYAFLPPGSHRTARAALVPSPSSQKRRRYDVDRDEENDDATSPARTAERPMSAAAPRSCGEEAYCQTDPPVGRGGLLLSPARARDDEAEAEEGKVR